MKRGMKFAAPEERCVIRGVSGSVSLDGELFIMTPAGKRLVGRMKDGKFARELSLKKGRTYLLEYDVVIVPDDHLFGTFTTTKGPHTAKWTE